MSGKLSTIHPGILPTFNLARLLRINIDARQNLVPATPGFKEQLPRAAVSL
jgi:hypothetical protein